MKTLSIALLFTSAVATAAIAQTNTTTAFGDSAAAPSAADIEKQFSGKTFNVKLADGNTWHVEYKSNGYFYLKMNTGFTDVGKWKSEDGKICSDGRKIGSSCNEIRVLDNALFLKRDSGEVVQFIAEQ